MVMVWILPPYPSCAGARVLLSTPCASTQACPRAGPACRRTWPARVRRQAGCSRGSQCRVRRRACLPSARRSQCRSRRRVHTQGPPTPAAACRLATQDRTSSTTSSTRCAALPLSSAQQKDGHASSSSGDTMAPVHSLPLARTWRAMHGERCAHVRDHL